MSPSADRPSSVFYLSGGWSPDAGWLRTPDQPSGGRWPNSGWRVFPGLSIAPIDLAIGGGPEPAEAMVPPHYRLRRAVPAGIAVAGGANLRPRVARSQSTNRAELRESTRRLLRNHRLPAPATPRIRQAARVDLNGDGREEVLWTARSRAAWRVPYRGTDAASARPGDYALTGVRFVSGGVVRSVALALESDRTQVATYRIFSPLDLDGDGRMEILLHAEFFEEEDLLVYKFDGRRVSGLLGASLPQAR